MNRIKHIIYLIVIIVLSSCSVSKPVGQSTQGVSAQEYYKPEPPIQEIGERINDFLKK